MKDLFLLYVVLEVITFASIYFISVKHRPMSLSHFTEMI